MAESDRKWYVIHVLSGHEKKIKTYLESEIVTLVLSVGIFIFILLNYSGLKKIPLFPQLLAAYSFFLFGLVFTILEGFFLEALFNIIQHSCYAVSIILIVSWCGLILLKKRSSDGTSGHN